jgi:hypothetical protein
MLRHGGGMIAKRANEFAAAQKVERGLDGTFREPGFVGQGTQTGGNWFPFCARRLTVKVKVNEIRRRLAIVTHDVAHQDVEDVIVDWDSLAKSRHAKNKKEELRIRKSKYRALYR